MRTIIHVCGGEPGDEATFNVCNILYYTNIIVAMSMQHCNYYNKVQTPAELCHHRYNTMSH